jgi:O-antigen/teichoic acid export membrane protein
MLLSAGNGLSAIFSFFRNIAIARLVSVEDFGIVVLLSLVVAAVETVSNLAIDRLLVQAPDGDDPQLQATAHLLQVVRGLIGALLVFFTATMLSALFKVPQASWAFQILALVPLIRSFAHLDTIRIQREMIFQPTFWGIVLSAALSFGLAVPLAYWLRDYSVIVWVLLLQVLIQTVISHLLASRPYRWVWNRAVVKRILSFGWPLLANGLLMFVIFQGDKAIIAVAFSPDVVGWYGAAFMLSMAPAMLITSVVQSLFLPVLSRVQSVPDEFALRYRQTIQLSLCLGLAISVMIALFGPELLTALFGSAYQVGAEAAMVLGIAQGIRIAKGGQFVCSIALGKTTDPLIGNLGRGGGFVVASLCVAAGLGPLSVAIVGLLSELLSYLIALRLLVRRGYPTDHGHYVEGLVFICLTVLAVFIGVMLRQHFASLFQLVIGIMSFLVLVAGYVMVLPSLRELIAVSFQQSRNKEE